MRLLHTRNESAEVELGHAEVILSRSPYGITYNKVFQFWLTPLIKLGKLKKLHTQRMICFLILEERLVCFWVLGLLPQNANFFYIL